MTDPKSVEQTMEDHAITRAEAERVVAAVARVERVKAARRGTETLSHTEDGAA